MRMTLTPRGPGTSICWSRDSGTSRKIFPPLRMTALSARSPLHSLSVSNTTHKPPSSSVSQSPALRCGRMAARLIWNSCSESASLSPAGGRELGERGAGMADHIRSNYRPCPLGSCEFTVAHQRLLLLLEMPGEFFGEIDRAVLPAGAAEGNCKITAAIRDVTRQPAFHEIADIAKHVLHGRGVFQKFDYRRVVPGKRAQRRIVVRIGQAAHIEYQISVQRDAMLEAERLEQQRQARPVQLDELLDPGTQRIGIELGGVDVIADAADFGKKLAFIGDALGQGAPLFTVCQGSGIVKRMQAARFGG